MTILSLLQVIPPPPSPPGGNSPDWSGILTDYVQFAGYFLAVGAVGYRYLVLGRLERAGSGVEAIDRNTAAALGLAGALLLLLSALGGIELRALIHHKSFVESLPKSPGRLRFKLLALTATLIGYTLARRASPRVGWAMAAPAILAAVLQPLVTSQRWAGRANAIHILAASTWLGTLTVMLFAGIRRMMRPAGEAGERARGVADIVNAFTPVALVAATVLALSGITTAWLHLKHLAALWETSYGQALIVKLCLVSSVVGAGWWNWKRVKPSLSNHSDAVLRLNRSATLEVVLGAIVLLATAVLVSLPSPK